MLNRRNFLKKAALASGTAMAVKPIKALGSRHQTSSDYFGVHEFIENHPEAVFIMKTDVDVKTNHEAVTSAGQAFGQSVFVPKDDGVPITTILPIKPNITNTSRSSNPANNNEYRMGIITDPWFVEGVIESVKSLGLSGDQIHMIETWNLGNWGPAGYTDMATRTGTNMNDTQEIIAADLPTEKVQWIDVPEGVYFRKIAYIWPINAENTWLLNISKFKAHGMGITLCCKNLQGTICHDYQLHCTRFESNIPIDSAHKSPTAKTDIQANYDRHVADGIPRWDRPGGNGGIWQETWASRCLDNNSVTPCGLHIIEGVYGRDGNGFLNGPNKGDYKDNEAWDYMSNVIIFGKDQYRVDIIGHWLAEQEPGNFGLFHMAKERGLSTALNPMNIPVYEWIPDSSPVLTDLTEFERTPLRTYYLQRDYDGQTEEQYHLCDEYYDYPAESVEEPAVGNPTAFVLHQNKPNPFNPNTAIEYSLPYSGHARLEVYNMSGQLVDVLVDGYTAKGSHMAVFNTRNHASGTYFYRFRFGGFSETKKMVLLK